MKRLQRLNAENSINVNVYRTALIFFFPRICNQFSIKVQSSERERETAD